MGGLLGLENCFFPLHTTRHAAHTYTSVQQAVQFLERLTGLNLRSIAKVGTLRLGFSFVSLLSNIWYD